MSDPSNRYLALSLALAVPGMPGDLAKITEFATAFNTFLENAASAVAPAPAPSTATTASAPASSAGAASPKRGKSGAGAAKTAESKTAPTADSAAAVSAATASPSDMFGEETSEAPKAEEPAPSAKAPSKATALTADNVRAALVDLQTKAGGRDAVNALLAKHTKNGTSTLSGLNDEQERFKAVIDEAKALVAAAAK